MKHYLNQTSIVAKGAICYMDSTITGNEGVRLTYGLRSTNVKNVFKKESIAFAFNLLLHNKLSRIKKDGGVSRSIASIPSWLQPMKIKNYTEDILHSIECGDLLPTAKYIADLNSKDSEEKPMKIRITLKTAKTGKRYLSFKLIFYKPSGFEKYSYLQTVGKELVNKNDNTTKTVRKYLLALILKQADVTIRHPYYNAIQELF